MFIWDDLRMTNILVTIFEPFIFIGFGVMNYGDGSVYEGNWQNGVKQGRGEFRDSYGRVFKGVFEDDQPIGPNWQNFQNQNKNKFS